MSIARSVARSVARPVTGSGGGVDPTLRLWLDYTQAVPNRVGPLPVRVSTAFDPSTGILISVANDVPLLSGSDFASIYNATEGTWLVEGSMTVADGATMLYANANTVNESMRLGVWVAGSSQLQVLNRAAAVTNVANSHGLLNTGTNVKIALAYGLNNFRSCRDGGSVVVDTSAALPTGIDRFLLGQSHLGLFSDVRIKTVRYWNARKDDVFLQQVTS